MSLERWDPVGEMLSLREAMDRLFQDSFVRPASALLSGRGMMPVDVEDTDDHYVIRATIPDVNPDDIQINTQANTITIHAETRAEEEREERNWLVRERRSATYHRSIPLPSPISPDQADARYENGVLTLNVPKAEEARPRRIKIQQSGAGETQTFADARESNDEVTRASEESFPASDAPQYH